MWSSLYRIVLYFSSSLGKEMSSCSIDAQIPGSTNIPLNEILIGGFSTARRGLKDPCNPTALEAFVAQSSRFSFQFTFLSVYRLRNFGRFNSDIFKNYNLQYFLCRSLGRINLEKLYDIRCLETGQWGEIRIMHGGLFRTERGENVNYVVNQLWKRLHFVLRTSGTSCELTSTFLLTILPFSSRSSHVEGIGDGIKLNGGI